MSTMQTCMFQKYRNCQLQADTCDASWSDNKWNKVCASKSKINKSINQNDIVRVPNNKRLKIVIVLYKKSK